MPLLPDDDDSHPPPSAECSTETPANAICCATPGYPEGGLCDCRAWGCNETDIQCTCGELGSGSKGKCENAWQACCANDFGTGTITSCSCNNEGPCDADEITLPSCGVQQGECTGSEISVPSCSQP